MIFDDLRCSLRIRINHVSIIISHFDSRNNLTIKDQFLTPTYRWCMTNCHTLRDLTIFTIILKRNRTFHNRTALKIDKGCQRLSHGIPVHYTVDELVSGADLEGRRCTIAPPPRIVQFSHSFIARCLYANVAICFICRRSVRANPQLSR